MKSFLGTLIIGIFCISLQGQLTVTEVGSLPDRVANNAVVEGFVNDVPYLFSFGGIDSTKIFSGIHLKSYRYNIETGISESIADLPDSRGKIASAASRIGNIIYISGGYNVFSNNSETSNDKMHRYDINNNNFLEDGADIPKATDDHVQVVWKDSLIFLITGWSNTANIRNVQIYNPSMDIWTEGTTLPNNNTYKSFGASGSIIGNTIYYYGGATSGTGFGVQNQLRKGIINPEDPTQIEWSISTPDSQTIGYRMASTVINNKVHWIGGSENSYNFDGIAYDGSGGVPPSFRDLYFDDSANQWNEQAAEGIPMDLRGIASINDTLKFIAGGMLENQHVTNKIFKLEWLNISTATVDISQIDVDVFPNPFEDTISFLVNKSTDKIDRIDCMDNNGKIFQQITNKPINIQTSSWSPGMYYLKIHIGNKNILKKVIKK